MTSNWHNVRYTWEGQLISSKERSFGTGLAMIRFNGKKDNIDQRTAFRLMVFCFDSYRDVKITLLNDLSVAPEYGFTGADSANIVIDATDDNIQILKNMYGNTKTMQRIHCDDEDGTKTIQDDSVREVV